MLFISTTTFVSTLAFFATLTGFVHAEGPRPQCVEKLRVTEDNTTCAAIGQQAELNVTVIQSLNPGIKCNGTLTLGDILCTKQYTPKCTLNVTAPQTATTGDVLAPKYNITGDEFVEYNDNVNNSDDSLVPGIPYCISTSGCYPGNTEPLCQQQ